MAEMEPNDVLLYSGGLEKQKLKILILHKIGKKLSYCMNKKRKPVHLSVWNCFKQLLLIDILAK